MKFLTKLTAVTVMGIVMTWGNGVMGQSVIINGGPVFNNYIIKSTTGDIKNGNGWTYKGKTFRSSYGPIKAREWIVQWPGVKSVGKAKTKAIFEKKGEKDKTVLSNEIIVIRHYIFYAQYRTNKNKKPQTRPITVVRTAIRAWGPGAAASRIESPSHSVPITQNTRVEKTLVGWVSPSVHSLYLGDKRSKVCVKMGQKNQ